jgi:hypothetical protein
MPGQPFRTVRPFSISAAQLDVLRHAARGLRLPGDGSADEAACLALWRAGLLRVNGESGFQLSQLGLAALRAQDAPVAAPGMGSPARALSGEDVGFGRPRPCMERLEHAGF